MSAESVSSTAGERAHSVVDQLESSLSEAEGKVRDATYTASEKAQQVSEEAQLKATESLLAVEKFVREKPLQAAGIAFAAGIITAMALRRR